MNKQIRSFFSFIISVIFMCIFLGCGSWCHLMETAIYQQKINIFFKALEEDDATKLKSLFSKTVISNDLDLNEQIDKLIAIYPSSTTTVMFDGLLAGEYENEKGMSKSTVYSTFPVINDNECYWVCIELIYKDDFSSNNVGLNRVLFYTADEYCIFFHDENSNTPSDIGLSVYAEQELESEVRCINRYPYEFIPIERNLKLSEIENLLNNTTNFSSFTSTFGVSNAKDSLGTYYYEIKETDGRTAYLEIGTEDDEILYANLVDDFNYIKCVLEE